MKRKKWMGIGAAVLLLLFGIVYLVAGNVLYKQLANIEGSCDRHVANQPDSFTRLTDQWYEFDFDYEKYWMPAYEDVIFPSREADITIAGWYIESSPDAPGVILVHGIGACKNVHPILVQAGMLHQSGFNVLLIDVRDVGGSTFEDGLSAIGNEEYLDVLGAWDWMQSEKGIPAAKIGLLGNSLGAATTLIAFSQEPDIAAIWVDSPIDNLPQIILEELERNSYPSFLYYSGIINAWIASGDNILAFNPYQAVENAGSRPLFVVHGDGDERVGVHHGYQLAERADAADVDLTLWIIEGGNHVNGAAYSEAEYAGKMNQFFNAALNK